MEEKKFIQKIDIENQTTFEEIVKQYKPYVEKLAFQFGIRPDSVPDVVQETFIKIHQNFHQFKGGKFTTWLYPITLNVMRDYYRKKQREWKIFNKAAAEEKVWLPKNYYFAEEEHAILHEAVKLLDEKYRIPIILFYFHEQSYEEIAIILNLKLPAVKSRLHRGRKKLKTTYVKLERKEADTNGRQTYG